MLIQLDQEALKTLGDPNENGVFSVRVNIRSAGEDAGFEILDVNGFPVKMPKESSPEKNSADITKEIFSNEPRG